MRPKKGRGGGDQDVYEKSIPRHGDVWFHKFAAVIRENPGQVIRLGLNNTNKNIKLFFIFLFSRTTTTYLDYKKDK